MFPFLFSRGDWISNKLHPGLWTTAEWRGGGEVLRVEWAGRHLLGILGLPSATCYIPPNPWSVKFKPSSSCCFFSRVLSHPLWVSWWRVGTATTVLRSYISVEQYEIVGETNGIVFFHFKLCFLQTESVRWMFVYSSFGPTFFSHQILWVFLFVLFFNFIFSRLPPRNNCNILLWFVVCFILFVQLEFMSAFFLIYYFPDISSL